MADVRHRQVRKAPRRLSLTRTILPTAGLMTLAAAGTLVVVHQEGASTPAAASVSKKDVFAVAGNQAPATVSRSAERAPLTNTAEAEDQVEGVRYAVKPVEIHADASGSSPVLATVGSGDSVDVTGRTEGDYAEIIHKGLPRWVEAKSIVKDQPLGTAPCATGSGSEKGLRPDTIKVHRAVCAMFPQVARYGGVSGRGEHATGQAIDIMVGTGNPLGYDIAAFLQKHRAELGIEYIIWHQHIWRPATSPAWRAMSDRGGATANHLDHVHVTTYGSSATS